MRAHLLQDIALRYFYEVAQSGSLTEASTRLHVAASAISRQIAALESDMGLSLFDRHPRGMVLTPAGSILAQHVRRTQLDAERALSEIEALQGIHAGQIRLATSDAFANEFIPRLCVELQSQYSGVEFLVQSLPTEHVTEAVRNASADIGLCFSRAPHKDIDVVYRQCAPVIALLPVGHALAKHKKLTLAQLSLYAIALPQSHTAARQMVDMVCSRQGLQLTTAMESNNAKTLQHFVSHGGGVSVGSEISARHMVAEGKLLARPVSDPGMDLRDIEVQTLKGRTLPRAVQAFVTLLQKRLPAQAT